MAKLLAPIFIFQLFCFYHIYTNRSETYWYFIIFIFPLIGGLAYLWMFYYSPQSVEAVADLASQVSADDHELKQRTSDVEFADTIGNKIALADAHMEKGNFEKAVEIYKSCLTKVYEDDEEINRKLLVAYHEHADYLSAILLGKKLNKEHFFQNAVEKVSYAWSYFELHDDGNAKAIFEEMNIDNTNYLQRKEYAKFLIETENHPEAMGLIQEMQEEIANMDLYEKRLIKSHINEIKGLKDRIVA